MMTVDPNNAIRIELHKSGVFGRRRFIFNCAINDCDNELRVESGRFKAPTGKCRQCARRSRPFQHTLSYLKAVSKHKDISVNLSYEDYLTFTYKPCHYCNVKIPWEPWSFKKGYNKSYYLDRKDNSKGYSVKNCVSCCTECNYTKGNRYSYEEFCLLSEGLIRIKKARKGNTTEYQ